MTWRVEAGDRARWIALCGVGEVLGLAAGALWYVWVEQAFGHPEDMVQRIPVWFFLALAGLLEGAVLGSMQAFALRRIYPSLPIGLWINLTIVIAIIGWAIGSSFNVFGAPALEGQALAEPPLAMQLAIAAGFGLIIGAAFGAAQMMALSKAASNAGLWIWVKALGWALAMPVIVYAAGAVPEGAGFGLIAATALGAGLVAGLIVGVVTSFAFQGMPARTNS